MHFAAVAGNSLVGAGRNTRRGNKRKRRCWKVLAAGLAILVLAPVYRGSQNGRKKGGWASDLGQVPRMYAFLLVLGGVIAAAGLALVASGVSIQTHTFDATNVTPGTIAFTGGCILLGLGFVIRALLRVERALMARPMPRPSRLGEPAEAATSAVASAEPGRIPLPPKLKATAAAPEPATVPATGPPPTAPSATPERLRAASPEHAESEPVVEASEAPLLPKVPVPPKEENSEIGSAAPARTNGAASVQTVPRPAVSGRPPRPAQPQSKSTVFDSLWPKVQRPSSEIHAAPVVKVAPSTPATAAQAAEGSESSTPDDPAPAQPPPSPTTAVSILKSGVVEGMAYTLYSDGSIEAQLPGGTLRFGSIAELRNHIEQKS
jgi:hypothetical protein